MSTKRKTYNADFKAKLVLQVLEGEQTLNELASQYEILPKNLQNWKKQFLENMSLAFDKSVVVKEYKTEIEVLQKSNDNLARKVGNLTIEKEFLEGKLVSLVSFKSRKSMIDNKLQISLNQQCKLLNISKSSLYYQPIKKFSSKSELELLNAINDIYSEFPYYGTRRIVTALQNMGISIGRKLTRRAMAYMGIEALYPKPKTSISNKEHHKYPYL